MRRGEVHLVRFVYSDGVRAKRRPACVVSGDAYNRGPDVIVAMVTSASRRLASPGLGDVVLEDWADAGLVVPSVVRAGRLQVIERRLLVGERGRPSTRGLASVDRAIADVFELSA